MLGLEVPVTDWEGENRITWAEKLRRGMESQSSAGNCVSLLLSRSIHRCSTSVTIAVDRCCTTVEFVAEYQWSISTVVLTMSMNA